MNYFFSRRFELLLLLTLTLLSACSSGGGSGSTTNQSASPEPVITTQSLSTDLPVSTDGSTSYTLLSASSGTSNLNTGSETSIARYNVNEMVMVLDQNNNLIRLGFLSGQATEHELSGMSTALVLLATYPSLATAYLNDPALFLQTVATYDEVIAFAASISATPDWSLGQDQAFLDTYANAVRRVYAAAESGAFATRTVDVGSVDSKSLSSPVTKMVNYTGDSNTQPNPSGYTQSGVYLNIAGGEQSLTTDPRFSLGIGNELNRYVTVVVGTTDHSFGRRIFMVGPGSSWLNSEALYYSTQLLLGHTDSQNNADANSIYAYGPGSNSLLGQVAGEEDFYLQATLASLLQYQVIPTLSAAVNARQECLKNRWISTDNDGFPFLTNYSNIGIPDQMLFNNADFRNSALSGTYMDAGIRTWAAYAIGRSTDLMECNQTGVQSFLQDLIEELLAINPITEAVAALLETQDPADSALSVSPAFDATVRLANKIEVWDISNRNVNQADYINISAPIAVAVPPLLDQLANNMTYLYQFTGDCPTDHICRHIVYPRFSNTDTFDSADFIVNFVMSCDRWGAPAGDCRNLVADFGDNSTEGGTKEQPTTPLNGTSISHTFPSTVEKATYTGVISAGDFDGAYADYNFTIQLEEAKPEIQILVDNVLYEAGVNDLFECVEYSTPITKMITIKNIGLGDFYPATKSEAPASGNWSIEVFPVNLRLRTNEFYSVNLTYNCQGIEAQGEQVQYTFGDAHTETYITSLDFTGPSVFYQYNIFDLNGNLAFDEIDLQQWVDIFDAAAFSLEPLPRDFSRYDLNGDGYTGSWFTQLPGNYFYTDEFSYKMGTFDPSKVGAIDLDGDGVLLTIQVLMGDRMIDLDESALTDRDILCYHVFSGTYTGANPMPIVAGLCGLYDISVAMYRNDPNSAPEDYVIHPYDNVTLYNGAEKLMGLRLEGSPVTVFEVNYDPFNYSYWSMETVQVPFTAQDANLGRKVFRFYDYTNNSHVFIPVDLTVSNALFNRINGTTLTYVFGAGGGGYTYTLRFNSDYTVTLTDTTVGGEITGDFTYSYATSFVDNWIECEGRGYGEKLVGVVNLQGAFPFTGRHIYVKESGYTMYGGGTYNPCPSPGALFFGDTVR